MTAITTRITTPITTPFTPPVVAPRTTSVAPVAIVEDAQPNYRAIYGSTIFAMALLFLFGVGFPASMAYGNTTGWAIGAFCAFWGGPSFGVMAGSARLSLWQDAHDHA